MIILPAIDLKGGRCVRLLQGRAEDETVYSEDPVQMALQWVEQGAEYLHVVDLDGAFEGHPVHQDCIRKIVEAIPIPVEVGGGLRTDADLERLIDCGVSRCILGTRAWAEPDRLQALAARFEDKLAVGIDARDGQVQTHGWKETTGVLALDLAKQADALGIRTLICTDTSTDGMMRGTNIEAIDAVCRAVRCDVIASGGVTRVEDVRGLKALGHSNLIGVIVGKALYEGSVTLRELQEA